MGPVRIPLFFLLFIVSTASAAPAADSPCVPPEYHGDVHRLVEVSPVALPGSTDKKIVIYPVESVDNRGFIKASVSHDANKTYYTPLYFQLLDGKNAAWFFTPTERISLTTLTLWYGKEACPLRVDIPLTKHPAITSNQ